MKNKPASRKGSRRRTAEEKLQVVMRAAALPEDELGAFLRNEGLHEVRLKEWRTTAMEGAQSALKAPHGKRSENTPEQRKIRALEKDLRRKNDALAEATALLILKKKFDAIMEGEDSDTATRRGT